MAVHKKPECSLCQENKRHTHGGEPVIGLAPYKRYLMIDCLKKFCDEGEKAFFRNGEDFSGQSGYEGTIWTGGEGNPSKDGQGLWNYYGRNHPRIDQFLEERGWYQEWYDSGTVILCPI